MPCKQLDVVHPSTNWHRSVAAVFEAWGGDATLGRALNRTEWAQSRDEIVFSARPRPGPPLLSRRRTVWLRRRPPPPASLRAGGESRRSAEEGSPLQ